MLLLTPVSYAFHFYNWAQWAYVSVTQKGHMGFFFFPSKNIVLVGLLHQTYSCPRVLMARSDLVQASFVLLLGLIFMAGSTTAVQKIGAGKTHAFFQLHIRLDLKHSRPRPGPVHLTIGPKSKP